MIKNLKFVEIIGNKIGKDNLTYEQIENVDGQYGIRLPVGTFAFETSNDKEKEILDVVTNGGTSHSCVKIELGVVSYYLFKNHSPKTYKTKSKAIPLGFKLKILQSQKNDIIPVKHDKV
jgi:hypothetical protein